MPIVRAATFAASPEIAAQAAAVTRSASTRGRREVNDTQVPVTQTTASPATILPAWVELNALPSGLEDQIPAVRGYKYVKLQDKVLLVLPESRVVVGEVAR
jgi:hypothetical protein